VSNPKFFVLKQIDKLLDDDFAIANETEAMVVDSIIRKMDRALAQFVELANTEAGVDDIHLLDKDDNVTMEDQPALVADAAKPNGETPAAGETVAEAIAAPAAAAAAETVDVSAPQPSAEAAEKAAPEQSS